MVTLNITSAFHKILNFFNFYILFLGQILFFPEGTDLTANTKARSNKFAEKYKLEPYEYVLHPRTAGFSFLVEKMRESTNNDFKHLNIHLM